MEKLVETRFDMFTLFFHQDEKYKARTIGAIKKYCKKHNIDPHTEGYIVMCDDTRFDLASFFNNTGLRNSVIKQAKTERIDRDNWYSNPYKE